MCLEDVYNSRDDSSSAETSLELFDVTDARNLVNRDAPGVTATSFLASSELRGNFFVVPFIGVFPELIVDLNTATLSRAVEGIDLSRASASL